MLKVGSRVKLSSKGFEHGVWELNKETRARRGTILRASRHDCWTVKWDYKKTPDMMFKDFLAKDTTGISLKHI